MALFMVNYKDVEGNKVSKIKYQPTTQLNIKNPSRLGTDIYVSLFKYQYNDKCFPPSLVNIGNKRYLMPLWEEVHPQTQLSDIKWEKPITQKPIIEKFQFKSSSSDKIYYTKKTTKPGGEINYSCSCPGFFRAKDKICTHIKKLK